MARTAVLARNAVARGCSLLATLIRACTGVIAAIILIYAVFVLFGANPTPMVSFTEGVRSSFGWFTEHLFSMSKPQYGEAVNAAIAALIYVVVGNLASKAVLRLAPSRR